MNRIAEWVKHVTTVSLALGAIGTAGCGGKRPADSQDASAATPAPGDLTAFELENGIGPVKERLEVGEIDKGLAHTGHELFEVKCSMCHKMDTTYVGPSLGTVTERRTPAYIMNMILNPQEMVERHPVAKKLLAERMTFMANQNLTLSEARAVLEYLRTQAKGAVEQ